MPRQDLTKIIKSSLKNLSILASALTSLLPGLTYFLHYAPPMFTATSLLSSGLALAVFVKVFVTEHDRTSCIKRGFRSIILAVFLAAVYSLLFWLLTVASPASFGSAPPRYQIGFGTLEFSLTDEAKSIRRELDLKTPQELMLAFGGYEPGGTSLIWHPWTIVLAGFLLIIAFVLTFLVWARGLALIARSLSSRETSEPT